MEREVTGIRGARDRGKTGKPGSAAKLSEHRESWVDLPKRSLILFVGHDPDYVEWRERQGKPVRNYEPEWPPVRIEIRPTGDTRRGMTISLTDLTMDELQVMKEFLNRAIDMALPIARHNDELAVKAFQEDGDTGYGRLYRPVPRLFVRERLLTEYRESVQERSDRLASLPPTPPPRGISDQDGTDGISASGVSEGSGGASSGIVPDNQPRDSISSDDTTEA